VQLGALDAVLAQLGAGAGQDGGRVQEAGDDDRAHRVQLEVALGAGERNRAVLGHSTWMQTITMASHWAGLTLPGMIEEPGSLAGRTSSPRPQRGPAPATGCRWRSSSAARPGRVVVLDFVAEQPGIADPPCVKKYSGVPGQADAGS
jgi:hypothetical protein